MGYDYDGTIEKFEQFKAEDELLLKRAIANGHDSLAGSVRKSIRGYEESIAECAKIRDEQSAQGA